MNLENNIRDCISKELQNGVVEKVIKEQLEECITEAVRGVFGYNSKARKIVEEKLNDVMVPYLEAYDYSSSLVKLDYVLQEVLKNKSITNKRFLENFKDLMSNENSNEVISISDLYEKWQQMIKEDINTYDIKGYDEYEGAYLDIRMNCEEIDKPSWSSFEAYVVTFECEKFEQYNIEFTIDRYKNSEDKNFDLTVKLSQDLGSLRYMNSFQVHLLKLSQSYCKIELDEKYDNDELFIEGEFNC